MTGPVAAESLAPAEWLSERAAPRATICCSSLFVAAAESVTCVQWAVSESPAIQSTSALLDESFLEVEKACRNARASVSTSSGVSSASESASIVLRDESALARPVESPRPQANACCSLRRSRVRWIVSAVRRQSVPVATPCPSALTEDRKSTRLNSSHSQISYAVFCLKKKKK